MKELGRTRVTQKGASLFAIIVVMHCKLWEYVLGGEGAHNKCSKVGEGKERAGCDLQLMLKMQRGRINTQQMNE